jgi:putative ABC transport system substrate-binding protein
MKRRGFLGCVIAVPAINGIEGAFAAGDATARIGWITAQSQASLAANIRAFRAGLSEFGYAEGRNLSLSLRYGDDIPGRVPQLLAETLQEKVDIVVAQGNAAFEIRMVGSPVPTVYIMSADPVSAGFAIDLAHPTGNMTGVTLMAIELLGKRMEILREIKPDLARIAVLGNPEHPGANLERGFSEETARRLGFAIDYYPTPTVAALDRALAAMQTSPPQAFSLLADGFAVQYRQKIIDFATSLRAPVISGWPVFARSGAVCTYGPRQSESYRRLAYLASRVLGGTKPEDLPVERPTTFELVVNVKAARGLGLTLPPTLVARADEVIE